MKSDIRRAPRALLASALLAAAPGALPAHAAIGGGSASVEGDRVHFNARSTVVVGASFSTHVLTLPNGSSVREYVNASNTVFAISWRGPARPDLVTLLGPKFEVMQADNARPTGSRRRAALRVDRADFLLRTGGHPGAVWGHALLPTEAPADFTAADFQ